MDMNREINGTCLKKSVLRTLELESRHDFFSEHKKYDYRTVTGILMFIQKSIEIYKVMC